MLIDSGCDLMDAAWSAIIHGVNGGFLGHSAKYYVAFHPDRMWRSYCGIVGKAAMKRAAADQQQQEKMMPPLLPPLPQLLPLLPHPATLADQQAKDMDAPYRD